MFSVLVGSTTHATSIMAISRCSLFVSPEVDLVRHVICRAQFRSRSIDEDDEKEQFVDV